MLRWGVCQKGRGAGGWGWGPTGGELGTCDIGNSEMWCEEHLALIRKYRGKFGAKSLDSGTRTSGHREWWLPFPIELWLGAVTSWGLLDNGLDGCFDCLEAVGHCGNVHAQSSCDRAREWDTCRAALGRAMPLGSSTILTSGAPLKLLGGYSFRTVRCCWAAPFWGGGGGLR